MGKKIALRETESGNVFIHADQRAGHNYATICGTSDDDDMFEVVDMPTLKAKINCPACKSTIREAMKFSEQDLEDSDG